MVLRVGQERGRIFFANDRHALRCARAEKDEGECHEENRGKCLRELFVEVRVTADPKPAHRIACPQGHGSIVETDPDQPGVGVTFQWFKPERRLVGIIAKYPERLSGLGLYSGRQTIETPPKLRERPIDHKRSQSMGSSLPSAASRSSCSSLAASFGLGVGSLMIFSHSSSLRLGLATGEGPSPDCRARAKSRSCAFLRGGNKWEIRVISATALFI